MTEQQKKILNAIKHCEEVIQNESICDECRNEHQDLKECLELVFEILPVLDRVSLDRIKELVDVG